MADQKTSELTSLSTVASGDLLYVIDVDEVAGSRSKSITASVLRSFTNPTLAEIQALGFFPDSNFSANSVLAAQTAGSPGAQVLNDSTFFGKRSGVPIGGINMSDARTMLNVENGAQANTDQVTGLVLPYSGHIETPSNKTITLDLKAGLALTVSEFTAKTSSGTITAEIQIDSTAVTGLSAMALTSTEQTFTATAANSVSVGETLDLVLSSNSSSADLVFTLKTTRA